MIVFLLAILLSIRTFCSGIFTNNSKLSPLMAVLGGLFLLYVFTGAVLIFFLHALNHVILMLLFILSPFITGKLVSYKTLKLYSIIQILCVILSIGFVILI